MAGELVAALDLGTSGVKAATCTPGGEVLGTGYVAYPTVHRRPAWAEQSPLDWWEGACRALAACPRRDEVGVLVATGQMQDVVLSDGGIPRRAALLYSDLRAVAEHRDAEEALGTGWAAASGNLPDASWLVGKLRWLAAREPEVVRGAQLTLGPAGWLLHRAGGRAVADVTTASTTGLFDAAARAWWEPALAHAGLEPGQLPDLGEGVVGELSAAAAADLGLPAGTLLVAAAGDAATTTEGVAGASGRAYAYLGTSGWVAHREEAGDGVPDPALHLLALAGGEWLRIGPLLSVGAAADWALRTFLPGLDHDAAASAAASVGPTRVLVLPSLAGERSPVRAPHARAAVVGADPGTDGVVLYRAALEGVAHSLRAVLDVLGAPRNEVLPVAGGGARSALWRQVLADVLDMRVAPVSGDVAGLVGAHRAAARAVGGPEVAPLVERIRADEVVVPDPSAARHHARLHPTHRGLQEALHATFTALATEQGADVG
ncbi:FGGY family carbohydrate kinase [Pseudonocardia sp. MH-G8]|uniref:FGGY family carbohydrate kinase n=1 Tax=Pseudonocardia sp. MH-G8 TaxID=1854588 RepID=UPI000BA05B2C|nr:FGGY family carbohydrate kinase [Pseudonocardia sp. MH-G8]OZM78108.1 sugar kinase [Pseudonocardia sp. MH-G8]